MRKAINKLDAKMRNRERYWKDKYNEKKRNKKYLENKEKWSKKYQLKNKKKVIFNYSNGTMKCCKCGFSDLRALILDHKNGKGNIHRKKVGSHLYQWLIKNNFPKDNYQVLCMNCQWIKRYKNKELQKGI